MFTLSRSLTASVLATALLSACGGGGGGGSGSGGGVAGGITCNTSHYTAGAVSVPTAGDMATYAKTYSGNTGSFNTGAFASDGGTATFVLAASGSLTYNGTAQTVNSICKDNSLSMIYVEFNTTGAVDFFGDGSFSGNLADASLTGVHSTVSAGAATPTVTGFTPTTGAVGTTVTISGINLGNFTPAPVVKFGTTAATVSSANTTTIIVTVPAGLPTGNSTITLSNFDGTGVVSVGTFNVTSGSGGVPATPTGVTATAAGSTQINLSWTAAANATGYNIYRANAAYVATSLANKITATPIAGTSYNDTGLTAGTTYYYKVAAVNATAALESMASVEVSATTSAAGGGTGTATGATLSTPFDGVTSIANTPLVQQVTGGLTQLYFGNSPNGLLVTHQTVMGIEVLQVNMSSSTLGVLASSLNTGVNQNCAIAGSTVLCSNFGITFDRAAGTLSFLNTPMVTGLSGKGTTAFTMTGSFTFTPF